MLLNDEPRNALMFADLSRTYIRLGQVDSSAKAIGQALRLAPDNRFILRAASRLFVHLHEPDRAHSLLMTSPTTRRDPWLLAAEIAIATVEGKSPLLARAARDALATNAYPPRHLSELASAVATIELGAGASRKARKLFERSLDSPTDNALAQAAWALRWLPNLHVEEALNVTPRAYEARTLHFYETLEWRAAVSAADSWLDDEAFSSRPAEIGSYVAAVGLEDYLLAERFARRGLVANPNDSILLNNLAFALASRGNPQEAWVVLRKVPRPDRDAGVEAALLATEGLIDFRMGDSEKGSLHYLAAIKNATEAKLDRVRALAGVYFARELIGSGRVGATEALGIAEEASRNLTSPDVRWLLDSLRAKVNRPPRI
jgi:tetratricopeptide (TPR) repeat protein